MLLEHVQNLGQAFYVVGINKNMYVQNMSKYLQLTEKPMLGSLRTSTYSQKLDS